jgi:GT2 family glycosyltransferase
MSQPLIQCVIVLYKQSPVEARSLLSLLQICAENAAIASKLKILVQDNSPNAGDIGGVGLGYVDYFHAPENPGLAAAYNRALGVAKNNQIPWLLTLDQDTALHREFLIELIDALQSVASDDTCALVPKLVNENVVLSPQIVRNFFYHRIPTGFSGFTSEQLVAFNSAACLRVRALTDIGGYPEAYWLDYLDHIVFFRLQAAGGRIYVLGCSLNHRLSLQNMESEVSIERYLSILAGEWRFVRDTSSLRGTFVHRIRLLKRTLSHTLKLKNKRFAIVTLRAALNRETRT